MNKHVTKYLRIAFILVATSAGISLPATAGPNVIDPSDDAFIITVSDNGIQLINNMHLALGGYDQGVVKFPTTSLKPGSSTLFSVNPYSQPQWGQDVDIYGFASSTGIVSIDDGNAGIFLGTLHLPINLAYGEDAFFDVTDFLSGIHAPYVGFNLRTSFFNDRHEFSSIESNYGHPSQLIVPEPNVLLLFASGLIGGVVIRKMRKPSRLDHFASVA